MKAAILSFVADWARFAAEADLTLAALPLVAAIGYVVGVGGRVGARLAGVGSLSAGPVLVVAAGSTLGVCALWALADGVAWALSAPYLSERILLWLAPAGLDADELRALFGLAPDARLILPSMCAAPIALFAAGTLYALLTWAVGGALVELIALEQKPQDVLDRERAQAVEAIRAAVAAGEPPPERPLEVPLADDRLGRLYKRLGHWARADQVEPRFLRWQRPLCVGLAALAAVAVVALYTRDLPIPLWVGAVVVVSALWRNARPIASAESDKAAPVKEEPEEAEDDVRPPFHEAPELAGMLTAAPAPPPPRPLERGPAGRGVLSEVLAGLGVRALWDHQAAALAEVRARRSVLLATAPGSGRRTLVDALALHALLADAERVLYLLPDRAAARAASATFEDRARAAHWSWSILSVNLAEHAGAVDPERAVPSLIFADPEAVHRRLCAAQGRWREFFADLGLVVVPGIDGYAGVRAAHLAHLFRRVGWAVRRARASTDSEALFGDEASDRVRVLATCDPGAADPGRYAERVAGRRFTVIGADHDATPRGGATHLLVSPALRPAGHRALWLRDLARDRGYAAALDGYGDELAAAEGAAAPAAEGAAAAPAAEVIVTRLSAARYAAAPHATAHLGRIFNEAPPLVLWTPDREPVAEHLAEARPAAGDSVLPAGRRLVVEPRAPEIERAHLRASLAEGELCLDELAGAFSRDLCADELSELRRRGAVAERARTLIDAREGAATLVRTVRLASRDDVHGPVSLAAGAAPVALIERSTGTLVAELDGARAFQAAYPRRVLVRGGRRYQVLPGAQQDQREGRRLLCEAIAAPLLTSPIRRYEVELIERRRRRRGRDRDEDRRGSARVSLGGAGFALHVRDVAVVEETLGVRRFDLERRPVGELVDEEPSRSEYETRAALLILPADPFGSLVAEAGVAQSPSASGGGPGWGSLHALVHLLRVTLPAALHFSEEDLEILSLRIDGDPAIAFLDLHAGGAGFADAITADLLGPVLRLARATLEDGGPAAVDTWTCRAPAARRALDAAGCARLLDLLLSPR